MIGSRFQKPIKLRYLQKLPICIEERTHSSNPYCHRLQPVSARCTVFNCPARIMIVVAEKENAVPLPAALEPVDMYDKYQNAERMVQRYRHFCENHAFLGESFPNLSLDFGPGSIAAYLGSNIEFRPDAIWFTECVEDWENHPTLAFDPKNPWFLKHQQLYKDVLALAGNDFLVPIPDLMENIDVFR